MEFKLNEIPNHLNSTVLREEGISPDIISFNITPSNPVYDYNYKSVIEFPLCGANLLDPYTLFLTIDVENINDNPIQLDNSAHSLISCIEFVSNGRSIGNYLIFNY